MRMTEQEFRDECVYSVTMSHVKTMLERGLISEDEYWKINAKMKAKYHPISDGLVSENDLLLRLKNKTTLLGEIPGRAIFWLFTEN